MVSLNTVIHMSTPACSYRTTQYLDRGSYGYVYAAECCCGVSPESDFPRQVAVKLFSTRQADASAFRNNTNRLMELKHVNVMTIYGFGFHYDDDLQHARPALAMEYCPGGNLLKAAQRGLCLTEVVEYTRQMVQGLVYLHNQHLALLDLKPGNVLLANQHSTGMFLVAKLADIDDPVFIRGCRTVTADSFRAGTHRYRSPEQRKKLGNENEGIKVGRKSDIWSLGVVITDMLIPAQTDPAPSPRDNQQPPSNGACDIIQRKGFCLALQKFLRRCFVNEASDRACAEDLAYHPLLTSGPTFAILLDEKKEMWTCGACSAPCPDAPGLPSSGSAESVMLAGMFQSRLIMQKGGESDGPAHDKLQAVRIPNARLVPSVLREAAIRCPGTAGVTDSELVLMPHTKKLYELRALADHPLQLMVIDGDQNISDELFDVALHGLRALQYFGLELLVFPLQIYTRLHSLKLSRCILSIPAGLHLESASLRKLEIFSPQDWRSGTLAKLRLPNLQLMELRLTEDFEAGEEDLTGMPELRHFRLQISRTPSSGFRVSSTSVRHLEVDAHGTAQLRLAMLVFPMIEELKLTYWPECHMTHASCAVFSSLQKLTILHCQKLDFQRNIFTSFTRLSQLVVGPVFPRSSCRGVVVVQMPFKLHSDPATSLPEPKKSSPTRDEDCRQFLPLRNEPLLGLPKKNSQKHKSSGKHKAGTKPKPCGRQDFCWMKDYLLPQDHILVRETEVPIVYENWKAAPTLLQRREAYLDALRHTLECVTCAETRPYLNSR